MFRIAVATMIAAVTTAAQMNQETCIDNCADRLTAYNSAEYNAFYACADACPPCKHDCYAGCCPDDPSQICQASCNKINDQFASGYYNQYLDCIKGCQFTECNDQCVSSATSQCQLYAASCYAWSTISFWACQSQFAGAGSNAPVLMDDCGNYVTDANNQCKSGYANCVGAIPGDCVTACAPNPGKRRAHRPTRSNGERMTRNLKVKMRKRCNDDTACTQLSNAAGIFLSAANAAYAPGSNQRTVTANLLSSQCEVNAPCAPQISSQ